MTDERKDQLTAEAEMCIRDRCKGCSKCARNCPASAIHGTLKSPYTIYQDACIRCGSCVEQCAFGAITVEK